MLTGNLHGKVKVGDRLVPANLIQGKVYYHEDHDSWVVRGHEAEPESAMAVKVRILEPEEVPLEIWRKQHPAASKILDDMLAAGGGAQVSLMVRAQCERRAAELKKNEPKTDTKGEEHAAREREITSRMKERGLLT